MPIRFDRSELRKPVRTPEGFLSVAAHLSRVGIQEYHRGDGSVQREYRPEEEVFHPDSLESIRHATVTLGHPRGKVTPQNWRKLSIGEVGGDVRADVDKVAATVYVKDEQALEVINKRAATEVSNGYSCELDMTPGEWNGQKYDAVQRKIRVNHVAIVPEGRAGREIKLHLDAAGDEEVEETQVPNRSDQEHNQELKVKRKIGGVEYEVTDQVGQALERQDAQNEVLAGELKTVREESKAQAKKSEELEAKLKEAEKARADGADPKKVAELVRARMGLMKLAQPHLDAKDLEKLEDAGAREVHVAVLAKLSPSFKADGKSDDAIAAACELALTLKKDSARSSRTEVRRALVPNLVLDTTLGGGDDRQDSPDDVLAAAYAQQEKNNRAAYTGREEKAE